MISPEVMAEHQTHEVLVNRLSEALVMLDHINNFWNASADAKSKYSIRLRVLMSKAHSGKFESYKGGIKRYN